MGLYIKHPVLFIVIGMFFSYLFINFIYNRSIGRNFSMEDTPRIIKLYPGEQESLHFELSNKSILPMINGQFRFEVNPIITSTDSDQLVDQTILSFQKSFSIRSQEKAVVSFPFEARGRGVTKIKKITYTFPHLFNFNAVTLQYTPQYWTEIIVFPKPLQVNGMEKIHQNVPGPYKHNSSIFEDSQRPVGTRDYEYSDPFYRINWKASMKMQQLQTNLYEKVVDMSYLFIVNINYLRSGIQVNKEMEKVLSYTTYLCEQAMKAKVPYELYMNARTKSAIPYLHVAEGEGVAHYGCTLEMLARIPQVPMTSPFSQMVYRIGKTVSTPKVVVIVGHTPEEALPILREWEKMQTDIFHVVENEKAAVVERLNKVVVQHA